MASDDLNLDDLDELVELVRGELPGQLVEVSLDPADLNLPGVWVAFDGITTNRLRGATLTVRLFLVAPDVAPRDAGRQLVDLFNTVKARLRTKPGPVHISGRTTSETVILPGYEGRPLPALAIPVELATHQPD
jgi:hypothetical protein